MAVVVFRVDASLQIGTGHVMRCLSLADEMQKLGSKTFFVCRPHPGHLMELIAQRGHQVLPLPELEVDATLNCEQLPYAHWLGVNWFIDAQDTLKLLDDHLGVVSVDWLVVDHYSLDALWEETLRPQCRRIMIIDDLADRQHNCDLLLDQNLGRIVCDYDGLLYRKTETFIGPKYALLRPEFAALRQQSLARRACSQQLRKLIIIMGGIDKDNTTEQILVALQACSLPPDLSITVVMGSNSPWLLQVQSRANQMLYQTEVLVGSDNISQIMAESDLAIGAAGGTAWERCSLGLPSFLMVIAKNQIPGAMALQNAGAAIVVDSPHQIVNFLEESIAKKSLDKILKRMSSAASAVTDGVGCSRVAEYILGKFNA